jgi:hypothetical protein
MQGKNRLKNIPKAKSLHKLMEERAKKSPNKQLVNFWDVRQTRNYK